MPLPIDDVPAIVQREGVSLRTMVAALVLVSGLSTGGGALVVSAADEAQDAKIEHVEQELAKTTAAVEVVAERVEGVKEAVGLARKESREDIAELRELVIQAIAK